MYIVIYRLHEDAKPPLLHPLFSKLYRDKYKIESEAKGADGYVEGKLIIETKTRFNQWLEGFYQALHYHKKFGLVYYTLMVIAHEFVGIWKVNKIPEFANTLHQTADANIAPNRVGRENSKKTSAAEKTKIQQSSLYWLEPKNLKGDYFKGEAKSLEFEVYEILNVLQNIGSERIQINTHNFIESIEYFKRYFEIPINAVHCFFSIAAYWDITSTVATNEYSNEFQVVGFKGHKISEPVSINPKYFNELSKYIESHYIFTNEGSGLTIDYYFSRFDEVMARIDEEYVKQHGIFFTNINLSKFALWFVKEKLSENLDDNYIVFDPAGGSGNLVSSWRRRLKHKIISELEPDLLRTIERRMKIDPFHIESGFTVIPKTSENRGLNFLNVSAQEYIKEIEQDLAEKNLSIDKPLAFLLNPPYKNTDENEKFQIETGTNYEIHNSIIEITGEDAARERYLAFLGQILNISIYQTNKNPDYQPLVLIFTPTSWLIPRSTFINFRRVWDSHFEFLDGFMVKSNEFFKVSGSWPLAFTVWKYKIDKNRINNISLLDHTNLIKEQLDINWNLDDKELRFILNSNIDKPESIKFDYSRGDIRDTIPMIRNKNGESIIQPRYDYSHAKKSKEYDKIVSGFPLKDKKRHYILKRKCGTPDGEYVGFYDDLTPVRVKQDNYGRMSNFPDRIWFRLDNDFKSGNKTKCHNGPPDKYGFSAYDLESAKVLIPWFCITKAMIGRYPLWANQYDIWNPKINQQMESFYYAHCFAYILVDNRCVVTKFEANNPIKNTPEIFVDNPLCPNNSDSFWYNVLDSEVRPIYEAAFLLVTKVKELYKFWNLNYCKGQFIENMGLHNEPYFKYFDYPDFLTPYSGLIQIKKYADIAGQADLLSRFEEIFELTRRVRYVIYLMLVDEFNYFS